MRHCSNFHIKITPKKSHQNFLHWMYGSCTTGTGTWFNKNCSSIYYGFPWVVVTSFFTGNPSQLPLKGLDLEVVIFWTRLLVQRSAQSFKVLCCVVFTQLRLFFLPIRIAKRILKSSILLRRIDKVFFDILICLLCYINLPTVIMNAV